MQFNNIVFASVALVYGLLIQQFYLSEKNLLTQSWNEQVSFIKMNDTLLVCLLALVGMLTLGIIGGGRQLAFTAFTYQVPFIMLKSQYESYLAGASKLDNVILFIGSYLMTFCLIEFIKPFINQRRSSPLPPVQTKETKNC